MENIVLRPNLSESQPKIGIIKIATAAERRMALMTAALRIARWLVT